MIADKLMSLQDGFTGGDRSDLRPACWAGQVSAWEAQFFLSRQKPGLGLSRHGIEKLQARQNTERPALPGAATAAGAEGA